MKHYLVLRKNGNAVCILKQRDKDDSIGASARENLSINSIVLIGSITKATCEQLTLKVVTAASLNDYLLSKGITPY